MPKQETAHSLILSKIPMQKNEEQTVKLTLDIPQSLLDNIKYLAKKQNITVNEFVINAIVEYMLKSEIST